MQEHLEVSVLSVWNSNTEYEGTIEEGDSTSNVRTFKLIFIKMLLLLLKKKIYMKWVFWN